MIKPFIRYIGGKSWYIKRYEENLPKSINNYYEPFLGSGSIFFYLKYKNVIQGSAYISDINNDLIVTYKQVQLNEGTLISKLHLLDNNKDTFYKIRSLKVEKDIDKAIRYLYLNRTGFGGIYRVNQHGEYNVPYGNRQYKDFVNEDNLRLCASLLRQGTYIDSCCFTKKEFNIEKNDFFCLDPPYLGKSEPFNRYNEKKFGIVEVEFLVSLIEKINQKQAKFILFVGNNEGFIQENGHLGKCQAVRRANNLSFAKKDNTMTEIIMTNY